MEHRRPVPIRGTGRCHPRRGLHERDGIAGADQLHGGHGGDMHGFGAHYWHAGKRSHVHRIGDSRLRLRSTGHHHPHHVLHGRGGIAWTHQLHRRHCEGLHCSAELAWHAVKRRDLHCLCDEWLRIRGVDGVCQYTVLYGHCAIAGADQLHRRYGDAMHLACVWHVDKYGHL